MQHLTAERILVAGKWTQIEQGKEPMPRKVRVRKAVAKLMQKYLTQAV